MMGFFFTNGVFMLKRTTCVVLGLAVNSLTYAGSMGPTCVPNQVTVPCASERSWELGAEALYLQSIYSGVKAFQLAVNPANGVVSEAKTQSAWDWAYRIAGRFEFNSGSDINANWLHYSSTKNLISILAPLPVVIPGITNLPANLESRNRLDQANLVMGQNTHFGLQDKVRFYAGMQYGNIQSDAQSYYNSPLIPRIIGPTSSLSLFDNTSFQGFGPSVGIDYAYNLFPGLNVTANGGAALLYGTSRYHEGFVVSPVNAIIAQLSARKKAVVPELEAKLGINYNHDFAQGVLKFDAGFQAINYFNALYAQDGQALTSALSNVNYGLYGPYFGLKYLGNA